MFIFFNALLVWELVVLGNAHRINVLTVLKLRLRADENLFLLSRKPILINFLDIVDAPDEFL